MLTIAETLKQANYMCYITGKWHLTNDGFTTTEEPNTIVQFPYVGSWELYNLTQDRTETKNLVLEQPEIAKKLEALWEKWATEIKVSPLENSG